MLFHHSHINFIMKFKSESFNVKYKKICGDNYLHMIDIEEIDAKLKALIDNNISEICYGNPNRNIVVVKSRLKRFLKNDQDHLKGAIAEFIAHVYLREIGFKQEFLFLNLEENSFKKGFDGFYSLQGKSWIFESKSGSINTRGISHSDKIGLAYNDLTRKISGKDKNNNNPWENALNHANNIYINTDDKIKKEITKLSDNFELDIYSNIKNFNIIPGSTIFLEGNWKAIDNAKLELQIEKYFAKKEFKRLNVICINKNSVDLFLDYIKS
jgi:hypothetical protein